MFVFIADDNTISLLHSFDAQYASSPSIVTNAVILIGLFLSLFTSTEIVVGFWGPTPVLPHFSKFRDKSVIVFFGAKCLHVQSFDHRHYSIPIRRGKITSLTMASCLNFQIAISVQVLGLPHDNCHLPKSKYVYTGLDYYMSLRFSNHLRRQPM